MAAVMLLSCCLLPVLPLPLLRAAAALWFWVHTRPAWRPTPLASMRMPCTKLSDSDVQRFDRQGFLVVRGALPPDAVKVLYAVLRWRLQHFTPDQSFLDPRGEGEWWFRYLQPWMDFDTFADLVLHVDAPIGGLAAQLLKASHIRFGGDALSGMAPGLRGRDFHIDGTLVDTFLAPPTELPIVHVLIILGEADIVSNSTGGSISVVPLDELARVTETCGQSEEEQDRYGAGFEEPCRLLLESICETPDLHLGDILFYSAGVPHRSQAMASGDRISYVARLVAERRDRNMIEQVQAERICRHGTCNRHPFAYDVFGLFATCFDASTGRGEYQAYWPSVSTDGISTERSACKPQVFPAPLRQELEARRNGQVHNRVEPIGKDFSWPRLAHIVYPRLMKALTWPIRSSFV